MILGPFDLRPNLNQEMQGSLDLSMTKKLSTNAPQLQLAPTLPCIRTHCPSIRSISPRIRCKHNDLSTFSKSPTWTRLRAKDGLHGGCFGFCLRVSNMQRRTCGLALQIPPSRGTLQRKHRQWVVRFREIFWNETRKNSFLIHILGGVQQNSKKHIPVLKNTSNVSKHMSNSWNIGPSTQFADRSLEQHRNRRHRRRCLRVPEFLWRRLNGQKDSNDSSEICRI